MLSFNGRSGISPPSVFVVKNMRSGLEKKGKEW